MPTDTCHIHWDGSPNFIVNVLEQDLLITAEVSNAVIEKTDPTGTLKIRQRDSVITPLTLPTDGWQVIPGTSPVMEARMDGLVIGYIHIRHA